MTRVCWVPRCGRTDVRRFINPMRGPTTRPSPGPEGHVSRADLGKPRPGRGHGAVPVVTLAVLISVASC
jgi:hypothetical protein